MHDPSARRPDRVKNWEINKSLDETVRKHLKCGQEEVAPDEWQKNNSTHFALLGYSIQHIRQDNLKMLNTLTQNKHLLSEPFKCTQVNLINSKLRFRK